MPLAQAEWLDITPSVEITQSRPIFDRVKRVHYIYVTVANNSSFPKIGRLKFQVKNSSRQVLNASNENIGYELILDEIEIKVGFTLTKRIDFALSRTPLTYTLNLMQEVSDYDGDNSASKLIKKEIGGEIKLSTGTSLIIPPNSLNIDTEISILDENLILDEVTGKSARRIIFEPAGLLFSSSKPAKLVFEASEGVLEDYDVFYTSDKNELYIQNNTLSKTEILPISHYSNTKGEVDVKHFSEIYLAKAASAYLVFALPSKYLSPGDILYSMSPKRGIVGWLTGHGALYAGNNKVIQSVNSRWNPEKWNQKINKYGIMDEDLGGVKEDDFDGYMDWYITRTFNKQDPKKYPFVGALRYKNITKKQSYNVINFARKKIDYPYTLIGNNEEDGYSCVGLIEKVFEESGLNISDYYSLFFNAVLPLHQWGSPKLIYVDNINVEQGDKLEIPVYGLKRTSASILSTQVPYAPSITSSFLPDYVVWNEAKCNDEEIVNETCPFGDFTFGHIGGEIPLDAEIGDYHIEFEVEGNGGEIVRRSLFIHITPKFVKPIAHYAFNNPSDLGLDQTGPADGVGSGNVIGIPTATPSNDGGTIHISQDNYIRVPHTDSYIPSNDSFTIATQFYAKSSASFSLAGNIELLTIQGGDFGEGLWFGVFDPSNPTFRFGINPNAPGVGAQYLTAPVALGQWHHAVGVVDRTNNNASLYLDGQLVLQENLNDLGFGSIDPTMDMLIGAYDYTYARNGHSQVDSGDVLIDDLRIYNRSLSSEEITGLHKEHSLAARYLLDGNANDSGINNTYDGIEQGGVDLTGSAGLFDGVDDSIALPDSLDTLKSNNAKSVFAWVKIPAGVSSAECSGWGYLRSVVDNSPAGHWRYLGIHIRDGVYKAASGIQAHQTYVEGDTLTPDTWHLIGFTWSPDSALRVYTDNNAPVSSPNTIPTWDTVAGSTFIGRQYSNPCGHYFEGAIKDVRFYDRQLKDSEVDALYNSGNTTP